MAAVQKRVQLRCRVAFTLARDHDGACTSLGRWDSRPTRNDVSALLPQDLSNPPSTHGLVAMTSAQHAEGRHFDPGWVYSNLDSRLPDATVKLES